MTWHPWCTKCGKKFERTGGRAENLCPACYEHALHYPRTPLSKRVSYDSQQKSHSLLNYPTKKED